MDSSDFQTLHRYGVIATAIAAVLAIILLAVGGPLRQLGMALAVIVPLAGFYFVGGYLELATKHRVLSEELLRGVVWVGGSLIGWAFIITSSEQLSASIYTVVGLPVVTALAVTALLVGIRVRTGLELKVKSEGGQLLHVILGSTVGWFVILYLVLADGRTPLLVLAYALAELVGFALWRWNVRRTSPA